MKDGERTLEAALAGRISTGDMDECRCQNSVTHRSKIGYEYHSDAMEALLKWQHTRPDAVWRVYPCPHTTMWHITSHGEPRTP